MAVGEDLMNTLQEYRDTREWSREANERLTSAYPTRWPMTKGQVCALSEEDQSHCSRYLGAEGPFWQVNEYLFWFDSHKRTFPMLMVMTWCHTAQRRLYVFLDNWHTCDATRPYWSYLTEILRGV